MLVFWPILSNRLFWFDFVWFNLNVLLNQRATKAFRGKVQRKGFFTLLSLNIYLRKRTSLIVFHWWKIDLRGFLQPFSLSELCWMIAVLCVIFSFLFDWTYFLYFLRKRAYLRYESICVSLSLNFRSLSYHPQFSAFGLNYLFQSLFFLNFLLKYQIRFTLQIFHFQSSHALWRGDQILESNWSTLEYFIETKPLWIFNYLMN